MEDALSLHNICLGYGNRQVLSDVSFSLQAGEIGCLLGESGCGKTTVLRAIAGLEPVQNGHISLLGNIVSRNGLKLPPDKREVGMIFQDFALFPHLSIVANIAFGLRHLSTKAKEQRVAEMLELIGLAELCKNYPHQLSGGQQQRVALARALAPQPKLLLLDEPFSSLDVELRERLSLETHAILKESKTTALLVTHNQFEAFAMSDKVGVIAGGKLQQWTSPYNLYHEPATRNIATFVGEGAFLPAQISGKNCVDCELGKFCRILPLNAPQDTWVDVLIRPDDILYDANSSLQAKIVSKVFRGTSFLYTLELISGNRVVSLIPSHHNHTLGDWIGIVLDIDHLIAFTR